ncbi:MAG: hypothetical protein AAF193_03415, partial [Bacteroidota bacterium]
VSYYAAAVIGVLAIMIYMELNDPGWIDNANTLMLNFIGLPFGVGSCVGFYFLLKRSWSRNKSTEELFDQVENY